MLRSLSQNMHNLFSTSVKHMNLRPDILETTRWFSQPCDLAAAKMANPETLPTSFQVESLSKTNEDIGFNVW